MQELWRGTVIFFLAATAIVVRGGHDPYEGWECVANGNLEPVPGYTMPSCPQGKQCLPCSFGEDSQICKEDEGMCIPCTQGDHCPGGTINDYFWTKGTLCEEGNICPTPNLTESCRAGYYCPEGTFSYADRFKCDDNSGKYCELGSYKEKNCPKGYYCPDSRTKIICPEGSYCKESSMKHRECAPGSFCEEGQGYPSASGLGVAAVAVIMIVTFVVIKYGHYRIELQQRQQVQEAIILDKVAKAKAALIGKMLGMQATSVAHQIEGFDLLPKPITMRFEDLGLMKGDITLLSGVTGAFRSGQLIAVMGPSGCGKSTLLNTLCNKATYGQRKGSIYLNEIKDEPLELYARVTGFVPQDDTVFPQLTVRENLNFSAELRLPFSVSSRGRKDIVSGAIKVLGLTHIQNSIVGSVEKRGISGGQKKRVNIGVELVADPSLLFLDEPTSGLGATDTLSVMTACRSIALMQRTVVAVIHQPRYQVFSLFNETCLLGPSAAGGRMVYLGPSVKALQYFENLGFRLPLNENPADFFLDCISEQVPNVKNAKFCAEDLYDAWKEFSSDKNNLSKLQNRENTPDGSQNFDRFKAKIDEQWDLLDTSGDGCLNVAEIKKMLDKMNNSMTTGEVVQLIHAFAGQDDLPDDEIKLSKEDFYKEAKEWWVILHQEILSVDLSDDSGHPGARQVTPFIIQLKVFLVRGFLQWFRDIHSAIFDAILVILAACSVGVILGSDWELNDVPNNSSLSTVTLGCLSVVGTLKILGEERVLFSRERASGVNTLCYFISKNCVSMLDVFWRPLVFLVVYYNLIMPRTTFGWYLYVLSFVVWACSGMGIFLSVLLKPTDALLTAVIFPLVTGVFLGGVNPKLADMSDGTWTLSGCSFSRWAGEALSILEFKREDDYKESRIDKIYEDYGYESGNFGHDVNALFFIGLAFRGATYFMMVNGANWVWVQISEYLEIVDDKLEKYLYSPKKLAQNVKSAAADAAKAGADAAKGAIQRTSTMNKNAVVPDGRE
ncbi:hypothetical protein CYMTET_12076 [Cymbomonas tetramitiformis]|uniref:Uncharacterized protein n=1 Tax=Cymbomonas tetramitiformis TaxID=36881 RepID=A0AAE0LCT8_9CHLO|nr:hypothetical protein CYMTET_12076 [Cymbomonas tetramitiformis]